MMRDAVINVGVSGRSGGLGGRLALWAWWWLCSGLEPPFWARCSRR